MLALLDGKRLVTPLPADFLSSLRPYLTLGVAVFILLLAMPYETTCPKGHRLQVSDAHLGQRIQCPACNESFVVPDGSRSPSPGPPNRPEPWKIAPDLASDLGRLSLLAGRPMVAFGLVLVLLSKGCDSISRRGVDRAEAIAQRAVEQFNDDGKAKELAIQREIDEITARGEVKPDDQKRIDELNKRRADLAAASAKDRKAKEAGEWRDLEIAAHAATTDHKINGYWRELFFVFAAIVLSLGLLVVSWGAQGAERWVTLMMLAIITFSLFIGGLAWMPIPRT